MFLPLSRCQPQIQEAVRGSILKFLILAGMRKSISIGDSSITPTDKPEIDTNSDYIDLENWMSKLPNHLTKLPIIYLSIPGSHNSFSYSLSPTSEVSPDSPQLVQQLGKWFKPLATRIVYNWSTGQKVNVLSQLTYGVRYFDIRLVSKDGDIYVSHGLFGGTIENFLREIRSFLITHQREVVILDFQHFYRFNSQNHEFMANLLEQIFGFRIIPRRILMKEISLDMLWREGCQVIIIYRHSYCNYSELLWPSGSWITPWPNKIKTEELLEYLDNGIENRREDIGHVTQGILTPTPKYVATHIGGSLKKLAMRNNEILSTWLDTKSNGRRGVNVVICDFIESYAFCDKVVKLNYRRTEYPRGLENLAQEVRSEMN